jgi:hypothetical protein
MKTWQIGTVMALAIVAILQVEIARASKTEAILKADNAAEFSSVTTSVQKEMLPGGRFEFVETSERGSLNTRLADMQALFDKHGTVAQMDMQTKVQLFNDQEAVNAILTRRDNERLICKHEATLGTHIQRTTCQTYGEMERQHRQDVEYMSALKQVPDRYTDHCPGCPPGQRPLPVH